MDLEIEQSDMKMTFLHSDLEEAIYLEQPKGLEIKGKEHIVCKLKKSLCSLKQTPRQWYKKFSSFMENNGYNKSVLDHYLFIKRFDGDDFIVLLLYVDELLILWHGQIKIGKLKESLRKSFAMKDLGPIK